MTVQDWRKARRQRHSGDTAKLTVTLTATLRAWLLAEMARTGDSRSQIVADALELYRRLRGERPAA